MKSSLYVAIAALLFATSAFAADDVATGQRLFKSYNCYQCHGDFGQGGTGPTIAPPQLPALAAFTAFLRHPADEMPAYTAKVISDADLAAIHAYLKSQPTPPTVLPELLTRPLGSK